MNQSNTQTQPEKFFSVRVDGKSWTKDEVTVQDLTGHGFSVKESRSTGDMDVFMDGYLVTKLFRTKADAAAYVATR